MRTKFQPLRGVASAAFAVWLLVGASAARAERIGVVVGGEVSKAPYVIDAITPWLEDHGHTPVLDALDEAARTKLVGCFLDTDDACAAAVVATAKTDQLVFVMVDLQQVDAGGRTRDNVTLTGLAFKADGTQTRSDRRFCEDCGAPALATAAADLAASLVAAAAGTSRVDVHSNPSGAAIAVDGTAAGTTPAALDLAPGEHRLELSLPGYVSAVTVVAVAAGDAPRALDLALVPDGAGTTPGPRRRSRLVPYALIGTGAALVITGGVLFAIDQGPVDGDGKQRLTYRDSALAGMGVGVAGLAIGAIGTYLLFRSDSPSSTVVTVGANDVRVAYARSF